MVFSSIPVYLDPPNWQQQTNHQSGVGCENTPPPPLPPPLPVTGGGSGSIRQSSMADRARLAKMPQPEAALKCPRCESTNTKFCYYNNYNSSQPRHFCKSCRRYWTRGGALRNVPVGGGSRRNKRSKAGNGSKSPLMEKKTASSSTATVSSNSCTSDMVGHLIPPESSQLQLFPYHHLSDYSIGNVGMSFAGIQPPTVGEDSVRFPIATDSGGSAGGSGDPMFSCAITENWRLQQVQQFPFLSNMENSNGLYALGCYNEGGAERPNYQLHRFSKPLASGVSRLVTEKMEENQGFNFPRNFLGVQGNDQFWGGNNAWNDLSGFSSSSTSHL